MLPKKQRITALMLKKLSKQRVFFARSPFFTLRSGRLPENSESPSRFSVVVSKKEVGSVVSRNRTRRLVYAVLVDINPYIKKGFFGVFSLKKELVGAKYQDILSEVKKALKESRLLQNS